MKKTFIKNHAGVEVLPDVDNFSCIKCQAADNNVVVKDTVGEDDEKYDKLNDIIHDLSCKLEKAKNELSETMEEKNDLAIQLKEAKNTLNEKTEKNTLEIKQFKEDLKKKTRRWLRRLQSPKC